MASVGIVFRPLNCHASKEMLRPQEEEMLERIIKVRLDRLVEAEVIDPLREPGMCSRVIYLIKETSFKQKGCCQAFSIAFLLFIARRGAEGTPDDLMEEFEAQLSHIPIVSLQSWSELTLACIVDTISEQLFGQLHWWKKRCLAIDDEIVEDAYDLPFPPFSIKKYQQGWLSPMKEILNTLPPEFQVEGKPSWILAEKPQEAQVRRFPFTERDVRRRLEEVCSEHRETHLILRLSSFSKEGPCEFSHDVYLFNALATNCFLFFDSNIGLEKERDQAFFLQMVSQLLCASYRNPKSSCYLALFPFLRRPMY